MYVCVLYQLSNVVLDDTDGVVVVHKEPVVRLQFARALCLLQLKGRVACGNERYSAMVSELLAASQRECQYRG